MIVPMLIYQKAVPQRDDIVLQGRLAERKVSLTLLLHLNKVHVTVALTYLAVQHKVSSGIANLSNLGTWSFTSCVLILAELISRCPSRCFSLRSIQMLLIA